MWTLARMPQLLCEGNKAHHERRKLTLERSIEELLYTAASISQSLPVGTLTSGWGKANHARTAWPCPAWFVSSC